MVSARFGTRIVIASLPSLLAVTFACVDVGPYACRNDGECARFDGGFCHAMGVCAYPDDSCETGARFSDFAGAMASQCTDLPPSTSTSWTGSGSQTSDSTSGGTTSAATGSGSVTLATTTSSPGCGDRQLDPGELCDDGNAIDGDGCNADCVPSGELRWSTRYAGAAGELDVARGLVVLPGDAVAIVGEARPGSTGKDILVARYDEAGNEAWATLFDHPGADEGWDITLGSDGDLFVVGEQAGDGGGTQAWMARVTTEGAVAWELALDGVEANAIAPFQNHVFVGGRTPSHLFVHRFQQNGTENWRTETPRIDSADRIVAIDATGLTEAWTTGRREHDLWVARFSDVAAEDVVSDDGPASGIDTGQAILVDQERIYVGGFQADQANDPLVRAYSHAGEPLWTWMPETLPFRVNEEVEDIAFDGEGMLLAVGFMTGEDRDAFIARIDPSTGMQMWFRPYPELAGSNTARAIGVAPDQTIYVAGELTGDDGSIDAWIAAFDP